MSAQDEGNTENQGQSSILVLTQINLGLIFVYIKIYNNFTAKNYGKTEGLEKQEKEKG